jgi:hypothetical protein
VRACYFELVMDDFEPAIGRPKADEIATDLRARFDCIIMSLEPAALRFLRGQCLRAERTPANEEILATIDRRLSPVKVVPPPGS